MKNVSLIPAILYLENLLSIVIKDFSTPLEILQNNEDPIQEIDYYKGFTDAIQILKLYYKDNLDEN